MAKSPLSHPGFFREGDYLTDQRRLYRVLQIVPTSFRRRAAILEDCRTLDTVVVRPGQLARLQLRIVEPIAPCTPEPA
jgi:hypothetical protein